MPPVARRTFLKWSALGIGTAFATRNVGSVWAQPTGANDAIRVAVIGFNWRGDELIQELVKTPGVRIAALCDLDPAVLAREVGMLRKLNLTVLATTDVRELLPRPDIDAFIIATGTRWHALLTIWACQAGKDVYVEKPVSRTIWEGRQMIAAAGKYHRIVQSGTQLRSDSGLAEAERAINAGEFGKIKSIRAVVYRPRDGIGRRAPWYPDNVNYDLFCGPTPMVPLEREKLHYDWHWSWLTGNGDIGNLGVHVLDIARRFGPPSGRPRRVLSVGARLGVDDAGETPNTAVVVLDYPGVPVVFELRGMPAPAKATPETYHGIRNGVVVRCEGGSYAGYVGGAFFDAKGREIRKVPGDGGATHFENFFAAMRSRRTEDLKAPIETGHGSTSLCHYGNISYRTGRPAGWKEVQAAFEPITDARAALEGLGQHLATRGIDPDRQRLTLGPWIELEKERDGIAGVAGGDPALLAKARSFLHEPQRPPYVIPELAAQATV
jgi:predicted dehydrogenase